MPSPARMPRAYRGRLAPTPTGLLHLGHAREPFGPRNSGPSRRVARCYCATKISIRSAASRTSPRPCSRISAGSDSAGKRGPMSAVPFALHSQSDAASGTRCSGSGWSPPARSIPALTRAKTSPRRSGSARRTARRILLHAGRRQRTDLSRSPPSSSRRFLPALPSDREPLIGGSGCPTTAHSSLTMVAMGGSNGWPA